MQSIVELRFSSLMRFDVTPKVSLSMVRSAVITAALTLCSASSSAEGMAVSAHVSLEGGGFEVTRKFSNEFNARIAYRQYSYQGSNPSTVPAPIRDFFWMLGLSSSVAILGSSTIESDYDVNGKQQLLAVMADWYPSEEGQSHFTIGLGYNKSNDNLIGRESPLGGYVLGFHQYTAAQVGKLQGTLKYNSLAPYIGLGWGNPVAKNKKWGFVTDIGMLYQGAPTVTLSATGNAVLQSDIAMEQARLKNLTWTWSPMVSVGLSYQW